MSLLNPSACFRSPPVAVSKQGLPNVRNVWILNHYAQEPGSIGTTRHFSLAQRLVRHGWQVTIIAASIEHNTGRDRLTPDVNTRLDVIAGIPFLWLRTSPYKGNGAARIRNMLDYTYRVLKRSSVKELAPPDAIIGSTVHPLAAWAGARLARRYGVPFIFEVRDLWPQTLVDMGRLKPNSIVTRLLRNLEARLYREASKIVVLLPRAGDYIEPLGVSRDKIIWIPNGADLSMFPENPPRPEPQGEFKLVYFGAHGQANALETVIDAMHHVASLPTPIPVRLHLTGAGPLKDELVARAQVLKLDNVVFHPSVPKAQIADLASEADAFVVSVRNLPDLYRYGISLNKIFDYMAAGRPIIMAAAAINDPITEAGAGITIAPEDPELLAKTIAELVRLPHEERMRMGAAGRAHVVGHYSFDILAERLAEVLDEAVSRQLPVPSQH